MWAPALFFFFLPLFLPDPWVTFSVFPPLFLRSFISLCCLLFSLSPPVLCVLLSVGFFSDPAFCYKLSSLQVSGAFSFPVLSPSPPSFTTSLCPPLPATLSQVTQSYMSQKRKKEKNRNRKKAKQKQTWSCRRGRARPAASLRCCCLPPARPPPPAKTRSSVPGCLVMVSDDNV